MPDIFDEVEEDLRAERARALGRRYAGTVIALIVLILVGTGGYVFWQQRRAQAADAVAARFIAAARDADRAGAAADADTKAASATLAGIAADGPAGYRVLARLRLAALQWQTGAHAQAIAGWQAVADDTAASPLLRDLATLTGAEHQIDSGDPVLLKQRLESLTAPDNRWRPLAEQTIALLDLRTGNLREAAGIMRRLAAEQDVPEGVRGMAADLLTTLPPDIAAPPTPPKPAPPAQAQQAPKTAPHG